SRKLKSARGVELLNFRPAIRIAGLILATNALPSPLAGEGGERGAIASASRERGSLRKNRLTKITPLPTSLGFASARSPSPARGEGKRVRCTAHTSSTP